MMEVERVVLRGWIDQKRGSMMNPWTKRFVVLITSNARVEGEDCKYKMYKFHVVAVEWSD